jgi:hypothetical protein
MGGNALKTVKTVRKSLIEYIKIKEHILTLLREHIVCENIIEAPEKDSFGDLDILYIKNNDIDILKLLTDLFSPTETVKNSNIMSFDYDNFQIDLIETKTKEEFEMFKFYYSYGDLGCILGKTAHFYKLKFGATGLLMNIDCSIDDEKLDIIKFGKDILLTNVPKEICDFFGLYYQQWVDGFTTLKQLFDWICSSKYFIKELYQIENSDDKRRMDKRNVYKQFMDYIWGDNAVIVVNKLDKPKIQHYALDYFGKRTTLERMVYEVKLNENRKKKYNGTHFTAFGFSGKEISNKMKQFEIYIENKYLVEFKYWLDGIDTIDTELQTFFST